MKQLKHVLTTALLLITSNYANAGNLKAGPSEKAYVADMNTNVQMKYPVNMNETTYQKQDIGGALPYIRQYKTTLKTVVDSYPYMWRRLESQLGWVDNYNSYLLVENGNIELRLPGEVSSTLYKSNWDGNLKTPTYINRIYSASPYTYMSLGNRGGYDRTGWESSNHTDTKLSVVIESRFIGDTVQPFIYYPTVKVIRGNTIYTYEKVDATNTYKVRSIKYADGKTLGFSYGKGGRLAAVADNRRNTLNYYYEFSDPNYSQESSQLVTKVELSQLNDNAKQSVTFNYTPHTWKNFFQSDQQVRLYRLDSADSTINGVETYNYEQAVLGYYFDWYGSWTENAKTFKEEYRLPVLQSVQNAAGNILKKWQYEQTAGTYYGQVVPFTKLKFVKNGEIGGQAIDSIEYVDQTDMVKCHKVVDDVDKGDCVNNKFWYRTSVRVNGQDVIADTVTNYYTTLADIEFPNEYPVAFYNDKPVKKYQMDTALLRTNYIELRNGTVFSFNYDDTGRLTTKTVKAPDGKQKTTTYTYDKLSNGTTNAFNIPNIIDDNGVKTTNTINAQGQITQQSTTSTQVGSQTKTVNYEYYGDYYQTNYGLLKTKYGPRHGQTVGQIVNFVDKTEYTYDDYGNLKTEKVYVTNMHNTDNSTNTIERTTTYTGYNNAGQPKFKVHPNGKVTEYVYDDRFRLVDEKYGTLPSGAQSVIALTTTSKGYNTLNQLTSETDADGVKTSYEYDSIGRLVKTVYATGEYTKLDYWPNNVIKSSITYAANGTVLVESYQAIDVNGRIDATRSGADGNKLWVKRAYDSNGNVTQTTTAQGIINKWDYDGFDRMYQHTDGNGKVHKKQYDVLDNISDEKANNASGSTRSFVDGQAVRGESNTDYGNKMYGYDAAGNLIANSHGARSCDKGDIDQLGRLRYTSCYSSGENDPLLNVLDVYGYDSSGYGRLDWVRSDSVGDPSQPNGKIGVTTSYGYDDLDRVTQKVQFNNTLQKWGLNAQNLVAQYSYTTGGKPKTVTLPSGKVVEYNYNANGSLNNIRAANQNIATSISTDLNGSRLLGWWWGTPGGRYVQEYDTAGQVTRVHSGNPNQTGVWLNEQYFFDADGRITSKMLNGNLPFGYAYDKNNQLTGDVGPGFKIGYVYDANGNRTRRTWDGAGVPVCAFDYKAYADYYADLKGAFGYDAVKLKEHWLSYGMSEGRSPCGAQLPQCGFDPEMYITIHPDLRYAGVDGREHYKTYGINEGRGVCSIAASTHHYNYEGGKNRMASYLRDGVNQDFSYQPTGELILNSILGGAITYDRMGRKKIEVSNSQVWWFDYNHKNERTLKAGPTKHYQYVYDENSHLLGEYTTTGQPIMEYVWVGDKPIAVLLGDGRIGYIVTDHKNTPRRVMDAGTGQLLWAWDSDGFGVIQPQVQGITLNLRFPGQYYDAQSGLYYNHNRYYNPQLGRYMEPDPIGLEGGLNPYAYAGNNPVMKIDSMGLMEVYVQPNINKQAEFVFGFTDYVSSTKTGYDGAKDISKLNVVGIMGTVLSDQVGKIFTSTVRANGITNPKTWYEMAELDAKLSKLYEARNYTTQPYSNGAISSVDAVDFMRLANRTYPDQMKKLYGSGVDFLDKAVESRKSSVFEKYNINKLDMSGYENAKIAK